MRHPGCDKLLNPQPGIPPKHERAENFIRAMCFAGPKWIPCSIGLLPATWLKHGQALEEIVLRHSRLFPGYQPGSFRNIKLDKRWRKGQWTDAWGTVWHNAQDGLDSIPVDHEAPLRDWKNLASLRVPGPDEDDWGNPINWQGVAEGFKNTKDAGGLAVGVLSHGFMYMRLFYLRGFENLMLDIATRDERLFKLIDIVAQRNRQLVERFIDAGAETIHGGDDLGLQDALPMRPEDWREVIKPAYMHIFEPCREASVPVHLHTDGHVLEIIPDLIDAGIAVVNPQYRANPIQKLAEIAKGRVCIHLDLDRQMFPFASPDQLRAHVRECIETLALPEGGLMLNVEISPDVPLENVDALLTALEESNVGPFM